MITGKLVQPNPNPPPRGIENSQIYPCFEHQTIPDILPAADLVEILYAKRGFRLDGAECHFPYLPVDGTGRNLSGSGVVK